MLALHVVVEVLEGAFAAWTNSVSDTFLDLCDNTLYRIAAVPEMCCLFLVIIAVLTDALILLDQIRNLLFQLVLLALFVTPIDSAIWASP